MTSYNVTLMEMYFIGSLYALLFKLKLLPVIPLTPLLLIVSFFWFFNNYVFLRKEKYKEIIKMFENETKKQKSISSAIVLGIFIFNTLLFFFALFILKR